jgi:phage recombination protein Bet
MSKTAVAERGEVVPVVERQTIVVRFAQQYGIDAGKMLGTLKATAFKAEREATDAEMMALLVVAEQYKLNPFTRELFAFLDKHRGIVPVVSVDGWARIVNEHPNYDGVEFRYAEGDAAPAWIECLIYRKDRARPTVVREMFGECKRSTIPWQTHPSRMLRHKAFIQGARLAFGFAGIYDEDEAARILEAAEAPAPAATSAGATARLRSAVAGQADAAPKRASADKAPDAPPIGTKEQADKFIEQFSRCTAVDTLLLAREDVEAHEWDAEDLARINAAFQKREAELAK